MSDYQVNNYGVSPTQSSSSTKSAQARSTLGMTDFLQLLAAQMSNQDVMNPASNTEFVSQMAQFSSLQAMTSLSQTAVSQYQVAYAQYGATLVGKSVVVASYDKEGNYVEKQGVVDSSSFVSGDCTVKVDGKDYNIAAVMQVNSDPVVTSMQYGVSLVGKKVSVSQKDDSGKDVEDTGVVTSCSFSQGKVSIGLNGKTYDLTSVTKVLTDSDAAEASGANDGSDKSSDSETTAGA